MADHGSTGGNSWSSWHPVTYGLIGAACGAAGAIMFVGMPSLHDQTAAAWAAAAATLFAALIALYLGLAPSRRAARIAEIQAGAFCQIAERALSVQQTHLLSAIKMVENGAVDARAFGELNWSLSTLDSAPLRDLIAHFGALPADLAVEIPRCIVVIETAAAIARTVAGCDAAAVSGMTLDEPLARAFVYMDSCRVALSRFLHNEDPTSFKETPAIRYARAGIRPGELFTDTVQERMRRRGDGQA